MPRRSGNRSVAGTAADALRRPTCGSRQAAPRIPLESLFSFDRCPLSINAAKELQIARSPRPRRRKQLRKLPKAEVEIVGPLPKSRRMAPNRCVYLGP